VVKKIPLIRVGIIADVEYGLNRYDILTGYMEKELEMPGYEDNLDVEIDNTCFDFANLGYFAEVDLKYAGFSFRRRYWWIDMLCCSGSYIPGL